MRFGRFIKPALKRILDYGFLVFIIVGIVFVLKYFGWNDEHGKAIAVDGDSLILNDQKVRLYGIDAPELQQKCRLQNGRPYGCGTQARTFLKRLIANKPVTCSQIDTDRYRRAVSICKIGEVELNLAMVKSGWALAYLEHSLNYAKAEASARKEKRGIWQGDFVNPDEWRADRR